MAKKEKVKLGTRSVSFFKKYPKASIALVGIPGALICGNMFGLGGETAAINTPPAAEAPAAKPAKGAIDTPGEVKGPAFDSKAAKENAAHDHNVSCSSSISTGAGGIAVKSTLDGGAFAGDWVSYTISSSRGNITAWSADPNFVVPDPKGIAQGKNVKFQANYNFPFNKKTSHAVCDTATFVSLGELDGEPQAPVQPGEAIVALTDVQLSVFDTPSAGTPAAAY